MPVVFMLIYQKSVEWWDFLFFYVVAAAVLAFGFEPLVVWIGQYKLITWKLVYSFPIFSIASFSKIITMLLMKAQVRANP